MATVFPQQFPAVVSHTPSGLRKNDRGLPRPPPRNVLCWVAVMTGGGKRLEEVLKGHGLYCEPHWTWDSDELLKA